MADLRSELLVFVGVNELRLVEGVVEDVLVTVFDVVGVFVPISDLVKFPPEDRDVFFDTDKRNGSGHVNILGVVDDFLEGPSGTGDPKARDFDTFVVFLNGVELRLDAPGIFSIDVLKVDFSRGELKVFDEEILLVDVVSRAVSGVRFTPIDEAFTSVLQGVAF